MTNIRDNIYGYELRYGKKYERIAELFVWNSTITWTFHLPAFMGNAIVKQKLVRK